MNAPIPPVFSKGDDSLAVPASVSTADSEPHPPQTGGRHGCQRQTPSQSGSSRPSHPRARTSVGNGCRHPTRSRGVQPAAGDGVGVIAAAIVLFAVMTAVLLALRADQTGAAMTKNQRRAFRLARRLQKGTLPITAIGDDDWALLLLAGGIHGSKSIPTEVAASAISHARQHTGYFHSTPHRN